MNTPPATLTRAAVLRQVLDLVRNIHSELRLAPLLDVVLESALSISGAERAFLLLRESEGSWKQVGHSRAPERDRQEQEYSRTIARQVIETGLPFIAGDLRTDERVEGVSSVRSLNVRSVYCTPLRDGSGTVGVLWVDHRSNPDLFDPELVDVLRSLAEIASTGIRNARYVESVVASRDAARAQLERVYRGSAATDHVSEREALIASSFGLAPVGGRRESTSRLLRQADRAARSDVSVIVLGERGTGKTTIAEEIHRNSPRSGKEFCAFAGGALTETLVDSELFGHKRGAFTGATADRAGYFETANGGTVFIDEVADLTLRSQAKLLRVAESGEFRRVGESRMRHTDVRIIAATNADLEARIKEGSFRADLYARLKSLVLVVPPLRERVEEIPWLVLRILNRKGRGPTPIEAQAIRLLATLPWEENIRGLESRVVLLQQLHPEGITEAHVRDLLRDQPSSRSREGICDMNAAEARARVEAATLSILKSDGNLREACKLAKKAYSTFCQFVRDNGLTDLVRRAGSGEFSDYVERQEKADGPSGKPESSR